MSLINIEVSNADLFVSFKFDLEVLQKVKSISNRQYVPSLKQWKIPVENLNELIEAFSDKEVTIKAPSVSTVASQSIEPVSITTDITSDFAYKTTPFDHQQEGFDYALTHNKFLLGDEQGLGKTKQSIDIAVNRRNIHKFKHTLIVCGVNSLKYNWMKEVEIHSNEKAMVLGSRLTAKGKTKDGSLKDKLADLESNLEAYFIITNVESLRSKEVAEKLQEMTTKGIIGMTIIDEIHKCKNPSSQQGKAIHKLKSQFKLALTGTPLMNKPIDLFNVMKWIETEKASFYSFKNRYCTMGGFGGYEIIGYKNLDSLKEKFGKCMLRRKKEDVLNLPPKVRSTEYVEMSAKQKQLYKEVMAGIKSNIQEIVLSPNPLSQLIRLRQTTAHTSILSQTVHESAKLERLKEMLEELVESGKKAIVFSNWTSVTDILQKELSEYSPAIITGKTKDRQDENERFQNDPNCKIIIGTIGAMGTGLTLTAASSVIFMDSPWNMANKEQAEDRAHRIGTTGTVNIVTLVVKDSIDERIEEIIAEKAGMAKGLVDGDEEELLKMMSTEDLVNRLLS